MRANYSFRDLNWFRRRLIRWFDEFGRNYPWRETNDPYYILVSEVMLRRTWASQVEPVYLEFIRLYPDIPALANAERETVKRLMLSLGLPKRAEDICAIGRELLNDFGGQVPRNRDELGRLTGVGDYVAGAVASMAFNQPEWIVDTNVVRVFIRFLGLSIKGEARKSAQIISLAREYARTDEPRKANYALLDHAALVCKPSRPDCRKCPVKQKCMYATKHLLVVG